MEGRTGPRGWNIGRNLNGPDAVIAGDDLVVDADLKNCERSGRGRVDQGYAERVPSIRRAFRGSLAARCRILELAQPIGCGH